LQFAISVRSTTATRPPHPHRFRDVYLGMDVDEVTLNVLLAEGIDAPTAYAASSRAEEPQPAWITTFALAIALLGGIAAAYLFL
jgi:hypothetical protein